MKRTIAIKLETTKEQSAAFALLTQEFSKACNYVVHIARKNRCLSHTTLHHRAYYPTRATTKLGSQMVCNSIKLVANSFRVLNIKTTEDFPLLTFKPSIRTVFTKKRIVTNKAKTNNWPEIKKSLQIGSAKDLIGLIGELYSLAKANKDFLEARFLKNNDTSERYKAKIQKYLAPHEPWKKTQQVSLKEAKKALSDYIKATNDTIKIIDLMIFYVECGTDFIDEFGNMHEQYYISLESVFQSAITTMKRYDQKEMEPFIQRLSAVVKKAKDMGWGYDDALSHMLHEAYPVE